jgi:hypothetical protein
MIGKITLELSDKRNALNYVYGDGCFWMIDPATLEVLRGDTCRERFASPFQKDTKFICFSCSHLDIRTLNQFFQNIEKKLGLETQTVFYYTNKKCAVVIMVSEFWLSNTTRRSIFSLFLRCGAVHYRNEMNFEQAIDNYHLTREVKPAIKWFMDGNITPTYTDSEIGYGFVNKFRGYSETEYLRKLLIKE